MDIQSDAEPASATFLWKQVDIIIDLYKFFFEWVLKLMVYYYTATGAVIGFYLSHTQLISLRYSLLLPVALSLLLVVLFVSGLIGLIRTAAQANKIGRDLKLRMDLDLRYLPYFLMANAVMCLIIAIALLWLFERTSAAGIG